jgi:hypothetical protein
MSIVLRGPASPAARNAAAGHRCHQSG